MHDQFASVVALARNMLTDIPPEGEFTTVRSASLRLVVDTLIETLNTRAPIVARPMIASPTPQNRADAQRRTIADHLATVQTTVDGAAEVQEAMRRADEDRVVHLDDHRPHGGLGLPGDA